MRGEGGVGAQNSPSPARGERITWTVRSQFFHPLEGLKPFSDRHPALALPQGGIAQTGLQICQPFGPVTGDKPQKTQPSALRLTRMRFAGSSHNNFSLDRSIVAACPIQIDYIHLSDEYRG